MNPRGTLGSLADTGAFAGVNAGAAQAQAPVETERAKNDEGGESTRAADIGLEGIDAAVAATCTPTPTSLCLNQGRFRAEVTWRDFEGHTGQGQAKSLTSDSGYFWFFDEANVELVVKALDGRGLNGDFWVFYGALSTVEYQLKVTDTVSGRTRYYFNPSTNLASIADTEALGDGTVVHATHDASRAVTQRIPTTGGTLAATGADGSLFTLEIPAGAFLSDQDVTMTPVTVIQGLPLSGGLAAAVHLEPEGILLYEYATLTIVPAAAPPLDQVVTFSYQGEGAEFFLEPPLPLAGSLRLPVLHLSGYGIGRGSQADIDAQALRLPTLPVDQLAQKLAAIVLPDFRAGAYLASSTSGGAARARRTTATCSVAGDALREVYRDSIVPRLAGIVGDCNALRQATPYLRGFIADVQTMACAGDLGTEVASIRDAMRNGQKSCYDKAFTRCVQDKDPKQAAEIAFWESELFRDGHGSEVDLTKGKRCLTFEIAFESTISGASDTINDVKLAFTSHLSTPSAPPAIQVSYKDQNNIDLTGSGPLTYLSTTWTGRAEASCTCDMAPKDGSTFTVTHIHFLVNPTLDYTALQTPRLRLDYTIYPYPTESLHKACRQPPSDGTAPVSMWRDAYETAHAFEEIEGLGAPFSADLDVNATHQQYAGRLYDYADKTYPNEYAFSSSRHMTENTAITLHHTPQP